ncbi:restriction endonuclease subunit S [Empedobacter falsenii]
MRKDWAVCDFGEIINFKNGFAFKSSDYISNGIPIIRIGDINQNKISIEDSKNVKESSDLDEYLIKKGDILIAMSGATTGKFGMYNLDSKAYLNQRVGNIFPISSDLVYKPYLFFLLHFLKRQIEKDAYGGAQPNISSKKIEEMKVPFIPLPEQRAIVKKIDALFSSLDAGIADLKKAQDQLKIYRQAVLKKAFEGELTKSKLDELSIAIGGFAFKSTEFKEIGKYQVIRIGNIRPDNIRLDSSPVFVDSISEKTEKYLLQVDDCVISLTGTRNKRDYGYTALVKTDNLLLNQRLAALRFNKQKIIPKYFLYYSFTDYFKNDFFSAETGNTGQGNVGMNAIKSTEIPVPSLEEQAQIVKEIEARLSVCDAIEQQIKDSLTQAEALRQSILKKAFEGKLLTEEEITSCKQEPDYEPASVLLDKIKAEKEANKPAKKKTTKKKTTE